MTQANCKLLAGRNVLISFATPKKSTRKSVQEYKPNVTDFCAKIVMRTISITHFVNSVSKYIQIMRTRKMILNGLAVINVSDG